MKRLTYLLLLTVMGSCMLTGCGSNKEDNTPTKQSIHAEDLTQTSLEAVPTSESAYAETASSEYAIETDMDDEDPVKQGYQAYDDIISFAVEGAQDKWQTINAADMQISTMLHYNSVKDGFTRIDINGDGTDEMIIGQDAGDYTIVYDIFTINAKTGDVSSLPSASEEDMYFVIQDPADPSIRLIMEEMYDEEGNKSVRAYDIHDGEFLIANYAAENADMVDIDLDYFSNYVE